MLVGFLQFRDRGLVVSRIKRNITSEIRIELRLLGIVGLVELRLSGGNVLPRFVGLAPAGRNAGLRVFPAEQPQIFVGFGQIGLATHRVVSLLVPFVSVVGVT